MTEVEFSIGTRISARYEIREVLGVGTLGVAYKAYDEGRNRHVVIKFLPAIFRKKNVLAKRFVSVFKERLKRDHSGVAKVLDVAVHDGIPFVVTEYLEGLSLANLIAARRDEGMPFTFDEVESIVEEVGQVLSYLHQSGFHGAVKPENIFLLPDRIKLTDDGLLEILPAEVFARIQVRREQAAPYLAPEVLGASQEVSREVDVFGLAAVTYTLLAGEAPTIPPQPLAGREGVPEGVDAVLARALADQPEKRYPSVNTFLLELARLGGDTQKIKLLESVVAAEAQEEAARTLASSARSSTGTQQTAQVTAKPTVVAAQQSPPPSAPSDSDASHLFEEEELDNAAKAVPPAAEADDGNLLQPTPAIGRSEGGSRTAWLTAIAVMVVAAVAGAAWWFGLDRTPVEQAPARPVVDEALVKAVERALRNNDALLKEIVAFGAAATNTPEYREAAALAAAAKQAFSAQDFGAALDGAQRANDTLNALLNQLREAKAKAELDAATKAPIPPASSGDADAAKPAKPAAPKRPKSVPVVAEATCPQGMVKVPAGSFIAGSPPDDLLRDATERPAEEVRIGAYCIDIYEYPNKKGSRPKTQVSASAAERICRSEGKRLCSEEEWERACKGTNSQVYPYGKTWDPNRCNTETATGEDRRIAPSGALGQCVGDFGVYDLSGNVMEWTASRFEQNASLRIAKGGSYSRPDYAARCAYRYTAPEATQDDEIGFRCCADL